jgi:hypothetical protein
MEIAPKKPGCAEEIRGVPSRYGIPGEGSRDDATVRLSLMLAGDRAHVTEDRNDHERRRSSFRSRSTGRDDGRSIGGGRGHGS